MSRDELIQVAAEAAHRALDKVDDGWHYECLQPEPDGGPTCCYKGHAARQMLVEDVIPAVLDAIEKARANAWPST